MKPYSEATKGVIFSLLFIPQFKTRCCPIPRPSTQAVQQPQSTACPKSSCSCFSRLLGFLCVSRALGTSASKGSSSSSFLISTSSRGTSIVCRSLLGVFGGLTSALLCHIRFPTAENCSHYRFLHLLAQVEIEEVVIEMDKDELFSFVYRLTIRSSCILTALPFFTVYKNHETTVRSPNRNLHVLHMPPALHTHFVHTRESSFQRLTQAICVANLELSSSTTKNALTNGCSVESSVSCTIGATIQ